MSCHMCPTKIWLPTCKYDRTESTCSFHTCSAFKYLFFFHMTAVSSVTPKMNCIQVNKCSIPHDARSWERRYYWCDMVIPLHSHAVSEGICSVSFWLTVFSHCQVKSEHCLKLVHADSLDSWSVTSTWTHFYVSASHLKPEGSLWCRCGLTLSAIAGDRLTLAHVKTSAPHNDLLSATWKTTPLFYPSLP